MKAENLDPATRRKRACFPRPSKDAREAKETKCGTTQRKRILPFGKFHKRFHLADISTAFVHDVSLRF
jgi:hypothetical protein